MIARITRAYVTRYWDSGQTTAYVEWIDQRGRPGRTEGKMGPCPHCERGHAFSFGAPMTALLDRAVREGLTIEREG